MNAHVVVNHVVKTTEEEKEQARKDAIQKYRKMRTEDDTASQESQKKVVLNPQPGYLISKTLLP